MELLHIDGKPFVIVPMQEYRRLLNGGKTPDNDLPDEILNQIAAKTRHPIQIIRKYRGLTQSDLASAASISRPYLTEIETGRKTGSIDALKALAKALDVEIQFIL